MSYFKTLLNELQVDGKVVDDNDDFNLGEDENTGAEDTATSAPADTADNAAEDAANDQQETQDNAEGNTEENTGDEEDDFTLDDEDNLDDTEGEADDNTDTEAEDAGTDDADDDFTIDGEDDTATDGEDGETAEGEDNQQQNTDANQGKDTPADPTDAIDDDEKRAAEEAIYDSLTDDQKRIRVLQLKIDYKDLYETIVTTMEGINDIPKNMENLDSIKRLTMFLTKAKAILIDYIENNFDNNTYLENYTMYIKYLAIFRTTAKVIEELNIAAGKKPEKE